MTFDPTVSVVFRRSSEDSSELTLVEEGNQVLLDLSGDEEGTFSVYHGEKIWSGDIVTSS